MTEEARTTQASHGAVVQASEEILRHHARSFSLAALFLTRKMKEDAAVCYAFCRLVDDAVDEVEDRSEARRRLGMIEDMLGGILAPNPIIGAYIRLMQSSGIGLGPARDLVEGARSDLDRVRIQDDEAFMKYCYRVAGTVGLMMCGVLGVRHVEARRHAIDLGIAMQMTNICRDVLEDAKRDRIYLPLTRLTAAAVEQDELLGVKEGSDVSSVARAGVSRVVSDVLVWAERYYDSGAAGMGYIPVRARLAIIVARALYRDIGRSLLLRGGDALSGRATVSFVRKCFLTVHSIATWFMGAVTKTSQPFEPTTLRLPTK